MSRWSAVVLVIAAAMFGLSCDFLRGLFGLDDHIGLYLVLVDSKYGYINVGGNMEIDPQFDYAEQFADGMAAAGVAHDNWGFIGEDGVFAISPQFRA